MLKFGDSETVFESRDGISIIVFRYNPNFFLGFLTMVLISVGKATFWLSFQFGGGKGGKFSPIFNGLNNSLKKTYGQIMLNPFLGCSLIDDPTLNKW
jgi:hypothetical protein